MRWMVVLAMVFVCHAPTATAQPGDWLIVPASREDDVSWMRPTTKTMGAALSERGARALPSERAATRFEEEASAPPPEANRRADRATERADGRGAEHSQFKGPVCATSNAT
jgi:hypothetical protein